MLYIPIIIVFILAFVFFIIGLKLHSKDKQMKFASAKTDGVVVGYSNNDARPPIVEYTVNDRTHKERLRYSSFTTTSTPFKSLKSNDLLSPKLKITSNSNISINTLMREQFPIGSKMRVYYVPDKPNIAYVERYAKNYSSFLFLGAAIFAIVANIILLIFTIKYLS